jgi:spermidine synthase
LSSRAESRLLPWLLVTLAAASGVAALIYQVVWMRRLALVFGSTTLATSCVLAAFLGGLAIGAAYWGRVADRRPADGLGIFGFIEAATGVYALLSPLAFRGVDAVYLALHPALAGRQAAFVTLQFVLCAIVIVPPAALMGGSLPLLARRLIVAAEGTTRGVGALYGWNTIGAAAGAGLAAYGALPALGLSGALTLAAVLNFLIAACALLADSRRRRGEPAAPTVSPAAQGARTGPEAGDAGPARDAVRLLVVLQGFALSGFASIAYEVAWTRLMALVAGSSVYAFGGLVVVVLLGLGIGSWIYGRIRWPADSHLTAFGVIELLIAVAVAASLFVSPQLPFIYMRLFPVFKDAFGLQIATQIGLAALVAFVPSLLMGATFPAVVATIAAAPARLGRTIGSAYGANTIGTVLGAFLSGFVLIPAIGLRATMVVGVVANLFAGAAALALAPGHWVRRVGLTAPAAIALAMILALPPWPREVFAAGVGFFAARYDSIAGLSWAIEQMRLLYYRDGINTTISVDDSNGTLVYRSNGKTDASTYPGDVANQMLLGHLPMLLHRAPRDVFVLGLGTAMTAAAVARYPVRRIDISELEPSATEAARFFDNYNRSVLNDPRVHVVFGDGRNRLRASRAMYDVVISDPSDIWVAGVGSLFTLEFYQAVGARLRPGGVMVQWIHTHTVSPSDLALLLRTFSAVFPETELWTSAYGDLIILGTVEPQPWDYRRIGAQMAGTAGVRDDLQSIGIWHPAALFAGYIIGHDTVRALTAERRALHTDDRPVIEFRTPRALYADTTAQINGLLDGVRASPFPPNTGFVPARDLDADATYLLGFAYASLSQVARGIPYMERSVRMAPNRPAFRVGLANQYREVGRTRDAEREYRRAIALDPAQVEALTALAEMLVDAQQYDEALVFAERALRAAPTDERALRVADRAKRRAPQ